MFKYPIHSNNQIRLSAFLLFACIFPAFANAQDSKSSPDLSTPEALVRHLYDQVTFPAGTTPDWDHVRTLFIPQSTVVMRVSMSKTATFSLDGWILDFVNFIHNSDIESTGFEEKIVKMESMVFGNIAQVLVLYTSYIPGKSRAPREGVDSFHLMKEDDGAWKIVSLLNEIPTKDRPKPKILNDH